MHFRLCNAVRNALRKDDPDVYLTHYPRFCRRSSGETLKCNGATQSRRKNGVDFGHKASLTFVQIRSKFPTIFDIMGVHFEQRSSPLGS